MLAGSKGREENSLKPSLDNLTLRFLFSLPPATFRTLSTAAVSGAHYHTAPFGPHYPSACSTCHRVAPTSVLTTCDKEPLPRFAVLAAGTAVSDNQFTASHYFGHSPC